MKLRTCMLIVIGVIVLCLGAGSIWLLTLPLPQHQLYLPDPDPQEYAATLAALAPPKRPRPLIAIIGLNDATETTDYLLPYSILKRANIADVMALSIKDEPLRLYPALTVQADATVAEFDHRFPAGADYVIVPAMSKTNDSAVLAWLRQQKDNGAIIIGVCAGATVVAAAGLLDGRQATTHWYYLDEMLKKHPNIQYVSNRRWVVDNGVATTTGITASIPTMLTLIEAIANRDTAHRVAQQLGIPQWNQAHDSKSFRFTRPFALTVIGNTLAFWRKESLSLTLETGIDEASLAFVADAWSRTYRSRISTYTTGPTSIVSRNGLRIIADHASALPKSSASVPTVNMMHAATALTDTLKAIDARYGAATASVVAMQLEYPWPPMAPSDHK